MGRAFVIGPRLVRLGFTEATARTCASHEMKSDEEDEPTDETSMKTSSEGYSSDETSFDDDLADDSFRSNTGKSVGSRPVRPQQPTR
jgi:hypothetical protein